MAAKKRKHAQVYQDTAGGWRWRIRAENGRIVATSGEGYSSHAKAVDSLARLADWMIDRTLYLAVHAAIKEARA